MVKKVLVLLVLLCIGLASGGWLADHLRAVDRDEAADAVRVVPSNTTEVYSIKRMSAEGACFENKYTLYGKGFEVLQLELGVYNSFSIASSYPVSVEFKKGCGGQKVNADRLCESLLGTYLTVPIKSDPFFSDIIGDSYLPISSERKDELFEQIQNLPEFKSKYYFVGIKPRINPSTNEEDYEYNKPSSYTYAGNSGTAIIEKKRTDYKLIEDEGAVQMLFVVCLIGGGAIGLGIGFALLRVFKPRQRISTTKQAS
jgi:hypothetical protein